MAVIRACSWLSAHDHSGQCLGDHMLPGMEPDSATWKTNILPTLYLLTSYFWGLEVRTSIYLFEEELSSNSTQTLVRNTCLPVTIFVWLRVSTDYFFFEEWIICNTSNYIFLFHITFLIITMLWGIYTIQHSLKDVTEYAFLCIYVC